ncbi:hypothetical protein LCGC14_2544940, partial [marine sediment metagenome]
MGSQTVSLVIIALNEEKNIRRVIERHKKYFNEVLIALDSRTSVSDKTWQIANDAGVIPTPTLALATREFDAGAMITASHNPPEYNGIKLLNPDGSAFDSCQRQQIEEMILDDFLSVALWDKIKSSSIYDRAVERHIKHILQDF